MRSFAVYAASNDTPHPAFGHFLPASGEKDLMRDPSCRKAGRGCREAAGEGSCHRPIICARRSSRLRMTYPQFESIRQNLNLRDVPVLLRVIESVADDELR